MMHRRRPDSLIHRGAAFVLCLWVIVAVQFSTKAAMAEAQDAPAAAETEAGETPTQYLRVVEERGQSLGLEIVTRDYVPSNGSGPRVGLVGVAHIGDAAFYDKLQDVLDQYDIVLYESVKPPGAGGAGGDTPEQRIASTEAALQFLGGMLKAYHAATGKYPSTLDGLTTFAVAHDVRYGEFIAAAAMDAWNRPMIYEVTPDRDAYTLQSLGADGQVGGENEDADLSVDVATLIDPLAQAEEDNLQVQLANAFRLEFQLEAMDYSKPNWRCSDLAMDEIARRFEARGLDFGPLGGTLAGSSFPAKVVSALLGLLRFFDSLTDGAVADSMKVVLIEMLGNPILLEQGMAQFGPGFDEVIIDDRNQVAIDDLKAIIEHEPEVRSVAIFYGAAHMPDMAQRLKEQLGYEAAEEQWLTAIKLDFKKSAVTQREIDQLRTMVKRMLHQQLRPRRR